MLFESVETQKRLSFEKISKQQAFSFMKQSTNREPLYKDLKNALCINDSEHMLIKYNGYSIGCIGIVFVKNVERYNGIYLCLSAGIFHSNCIHKTMYISYLEIINQKVREIGVPAVDIIASVFENIKTYAKAEQIDYIIAAGKDFRRNIMYIRGGFVNAFDDLQIEKHYKMKFRINPMLRYSLTDKAEQYIITLQHEAKKLIKA